MSARMPLRPWPSTTLFMVLCISHCLNMFVWCVCVHFTVCVCVREKERHENDSVEVCVFWCDSEVPQVTAREHSISTPASRRTTWTASALGGGVWKLIRWNCGRVKINSDFHPDLCVWKWLENEFAGCAEAWKLIRILAPIWIENEREGRGGVKINSDFHPDLYVWK